MFLVQGHAVSGGIRFTSRSSEYLQLIFDNRSDTYKPCVPKVALLSPLCL